MAATHHIIHARPTEAEVDVLNLLLDGYSNKEIAQKLSLAESTIKTHLKRVSYDVRARSRTHLAVIYSMWKYGRWDRWPKWDARRRNHSNSCAIFKDLYCDCAER